MFKNIIDKQWKKCHNFLIPNDINYIANYK